jgi:acyl-coenzyme A synthetase/AMP-(fatty) acid ligase
MDGYIGTESNDVLIDGERFLVTPDHGYVGVDGRIYVLNRSAGKVEDFDVYAVEEAVRTLPGVRDVAIVIEPESGRQPDKADGVIVLKDPYSIDVEALFDKVGEALRAHGLERRHVRFVDSIPYSLSGKIRWTDVAALLAQPASASRDTFAFVK